MRIERNYYTEAQNTLDEVAAVASEKSTRSEHRQYQREGVGLPQPPFPFRSEVEMLLSKSRPIKGRIIQFQYIGARALWLAKRCEMNVVVEQEQMKTGVIQLESDYFLLFGSRFAPLWSAFYELLCAADEFSISHKETTFLLEFRFELSDTETQ